ncbi:ATP-dependent DNA helicase [Kushneria indalinina]|uniref:Rad3-related DNA helicase n=1 Tax=Kushneria indalinina DSM 14324 TaxID=1122140 RepID=A0A3D9E0B6_9GAMM|nr:ATP-dependent DNA helicase [Kushneria indalinina]REC96480.1 Rad3-related DNA helicase [Kushneria indalinina DSM 14324]
MSTAPAITAPTDVESPRYRVAVRALCEFTARTGDLDLRFTPAPTAQQGIAGHQVVASRRGEHYEHEVTLEGQYGALVVRGRADGYDPVRQRLEEVKTRRGDIEAMPANQRALHWAQAKVYAALMCRERGLESLEVALVYFDIEQQRETVLVETMDRHALEAFFIVQCERFIDWAEQELAHEAARAQRLAQLEFPHADFRPGQRALAESVFKAISTRRDLMLQAPTGIGKTLGTLFPALKAMPGQQLDRLFFLTARTTGRRLALEALTTLGMAEACEEGAGSSVRTLELIARDKACEHPDLACHGDSCPLASGFYDRLPEARQAAVDKGWLDHAGLKEVALAHRVCPYYLGQEMAHWCDVVIGDVNYWFDTSAMLYAMARQHQWRVSVLIDEAHNLVERGRAMYGAEFDQGRFAPARRDAPPALKRPLDRLWRQWKALLREHDGNYVCLEAPPRKLFNALSQFVTAVGDLMVETPVGLESALLEAWFDAMQIVRIAELAGECDPDHYLFDIERRGKSATLSLRNVVPAPLLAARFEAAHSAILFSATLSPGHYYRDQLGLAPSTPWLEMASPFTGGQLEVHLAGHISTRYRDRAASLAPIAALMADQFYQRPGNYLAFFSSFDYLEQVREALAEHAPDVPQWSQARRMSEPERDAFLARFTLDGQGIGFAVLGGIFGEGIDLPGERLIGAFVATLGLAQFNPVNEQMKARMETLFGDGYRYAYLYPGITRVVQAAGRVIRSPEDRGVIHLIDDRFRRGEIQALLPSWWALPSADRSNDLSG